MDRSIAVTEQGNTFVGLVAGTIIDAVSALFFVQSNKARILMTEFFDKLRTDRKFEESLRLADSIPNTDAQSRLKILMALNFAEVSPNEAILKEILVAQFTANENPVVPVSNQALAGGAVASRLPAE